MKQYNHTHCDKTAVLDPGAGCEGSAVSYTLCTNGYRGCLLHQNSGTISDITGGPLREYGNPNEETGRNYTFSVSLFSDSVQLQ